MNVKSFLVETLKEYPNNARRGNVEALVESLKVNGQYRPIVVQKSTKYVLAGNHLLRAARQIGWDEINAVEIDCDDAQALKIVLADNRTAELGDYDNTALISLLQELEDFEGTGYSQTDLEDLDTILKPEPESRPELEFSIAMREENNYVVLLFRDAIDWQTACSVLDISTKKSWDSRKGYERNGVGRVIDGAEVITRLLSANS